LDGLGGNTHTDDGSDRDFTLLERKEAGAEVHTPEDVRWSIAQRPPQIRMIRAANDEFAGLTRLQRLIVMMLGGFVTTHARTEGPLQRAADKRRGSHLQTGTVELIDQLLLARLPHQCRIHRMEDQIAGSVAQLQVEHQSRAGCFLPFLLIDFRDQEQGTLFDPERLDAELPNG